jgi:DNA-binding winged helix-turn-helix (wHTH) protein
MLTTTELAARDDFRLGNVVVAPPTRTISGPAGRADVEPRVMQVLVVLADAAGQVVTRETLFNRCWGSVYVGDDSLNRAVGAMRRAVAEVGGEGFEIETIPRTGYRLTGVMPKALGSADDTLARSTLRLSRRQLAGGGLAVLTLGGVGLWLGLDARSDARFDELIGQAEAAIRNEDANPRTIRVLEEAVAIRPDSAKAWGLLALFNSVLSQFADPKDSAHMIGGAQAAARRALSLDRNEPNALLAMFELEGSTLDWFTRDRRLRKVLAIDPANVFAISELVLLLQAAGMNRESRAWNERAISLVPLSLDFLTKRALKLWIADRVPEADKVIDQVRALYPTNDWAWWVRLLIFATTGRAGAALAMLDANPGMIPDPAEAALWRTALSAFADPSPAAVARTRLASFHAAKVARQTDGPGVMILSALGDVDGAFAIADGSLLSRGSIIRVAGSKAPVEDSIDRVNMQWLFTPPCAEMRADPRFGPLCDGIGLTEYWRRRGVRPDYLTFER